MRQHKRVAIVGGGMMGVGLLYHLAEMGWKECLLIEKGELTSGSTWHAAGQCASFQGHYNISKIHHYGNLLYPKLESMTGQYVSWHGCGGIRIATSQEEADWFRYVLGISRNIGYRMELIGPDEIKRINPFMDTTGVILGAHTLDDGHVDPAGACNAMAIAAKNMGGEIMKRTLVTGIERLPTGEWLVKTENAGEFSCEHVVNAGGCYAREVGKWVDLDVPITNMEHQYLVTESLPEFRGRDVELPVFRDSYTAGYYRQEQKAGLIGIYEHTAAREAWVHRGGWPEWSAENELFEGDLDRISPWLANALERMPIFAKAGIKRIVNGAIPHTPDGLPLLGPSGQKNFWQCCGASIGIAQGAGCGKYLAEWIVNGEAEINMKDFDPRRFGAWADQTYTRAKSFEDYHHMFVAHLPGEEREAGRPVRQSPLHEVLKDQGCAFMEGAGYERPKFFHPEGKPEAPGYRRNNAFPLVAEECRAVRERVGVADLTSFAKYDVTGPDAAAFLDRILANKLPKKVGGIMLTHLLTENGMIETEFTVTKLADDLFYLLSSIGAEMRDLDHLTSLKAAGEQVTITNMTDKMGVLVVAGPRARDVLQGLTQADLGNSNFRWLTAQEMSVASVPLRAMRVNYVGELGWELHTPRDQMVALYQKVWAAGQPHGIANFGLYAVNSLRMEKAYRGWGAELTNEITMIEADMERFFAPDKGAFRGREATLKRRAEGIKTKLVYLKVNVSDNDVRGGEPILVDGQAVGVITSGGYGHTVKTGLAFGYVRPDLAAPGTRFEVELLDERRPAEVLAEPIFDPASERARA